MTHAGPVQQSSALSLQNEWQNQPSLSAGPLIGSLLSEIDFYKLPASDDSAAVPAKQLHAAHCLSCAYVRQSHVICELRGLVARRLLPLGLIQPPPASRDHQNTQTAALSLH